MSPTSTAPAPFAVAVTPHASTNIPGDVRALYVGGAGNLAVVFRDDSVVTFTAVPAGAILPLNAKRVNATGTTATAIVALY